MRDGPHFLLGLAWPLGRVAEFARAIRENRQPECAGEDNIKSLAVIEAMLRSIESGRVEPVRLAAGSSARPARR